jgi:RNA polymerase-interacting CarD/CdnL/TRCF family regulator
MTQPKDQIGKLIINNELGIGEIVEVTDMGGEDFFRVSFKKSEATNFYSTKVQKNYRMISSKEAIEDAISEFIENEGPRTFGSIQEKVNFYKKELKTNDVKALAKHLAQINAQEEIHPAVQPLFDKALKTFVKEIDYVLDIKNIEAWGLLGLKKNNK